MVPSKGQSLTAETKRLLELWEGIEKSKIWGPFMKAAKEKDYERFKGMADVFCHI